MGLLGIWKSIKVFFGGKDVFIFIFKFTFTVESITEAKMFFKNKLNF